MFSNNLRNNELEFTPTFETQLDRMRATIKQAIELTHVEFEKDANKSIKDGNIIFPNYYIRFVRAFDCLEQQIEDNLQNTPKDPRGEDKVGFQNQIQKTEFLIFCSTDGKIRIETRMINESVWLSATEMAELFTVDKSGIRKHLKNIFETKELERDSVSAFFASTASDGKTYQIEYFNLDAIISVGYRVNSVIGTHFRMWAKSVNHVCKPNAFVLYGMPFCATQNSNIQAQGLQCYV
jgi:hypothetical protein